MPATPITGNYHSKTHGEMQYQVNADRSSVLVLATWSKADGGDGNQHKITLARSKTGHLTPTLFDGNSSAIIIQALKDGIKQGGDTAATDQKYLDKINGLLAEVPNAASTITKTIRQTDGAPHVATVGSGDEEPKDTRAAKKQAKAEAAKTEATKSEQPPKPAAKQAPGTTTIFIPGEGAAAQPAAVAAPAATYAPQYAAPAAATTQVAGDEHRVSYTGHGGRRHSLHLRGATSQDGGQVVTLTGAGRADVAALADGDQGPALKALQRDARHASGARLASDLRMINVVEGLTQIPHPEDAATYTSTKSGKKAAAKQDGGQHHRHAAAAPKPHGV